MNGELLTPGVPVLSDEWISQRTQHLVEEIATPSPRRRRLVLSGISTGTVAVAAALVGLLGPWATPAFAGWSAQTTTPSTGQLSTAEAQCATLATDLASSPGSTASATLPPVSLSDVRGPYTLIVYGTKNPALCVSGSDLTSLHENGGSISKATVTLTRASGQVTVGGFSDSKWLSGATSSPDGAVVNLIYSNSENGQSFTVAEGSVGSDVTGATFELSDGTSVETTVSNGLFAAWWPGMASVSSTQVTSTAGVN